MTVRSGATGRPPALPAAWWLTVGPHGRDLGPQQTQGSMSPVQPLGVMDELGGTSGLSSDDSCPLTQVLGPSRLCLQASGPWLFPGVAERRPCSCRRATSQHVEEVSSHSEPVRTRERLHGCSSLPRWHRPTVGALSPYGTAQGIASKCRLRFHNTVRSHSQL